MSCFSPPEPLWGDLGQKDAVRVHLEADAFLYLSEFCRPPSIDELAAQINRLCGKSLHLLLHPNPLAPNSCRDEEKKERDVKKLNVEVEWQL